MFKLENLQFLLDHIKIKKDQVFLHVKLLTLFMPLSI